MRGRADLVLALVACTVVAGSTRSRNGAAARTGGGTTVQTRCVDALGLACDCGPTCQLCGPAFGAGTPQFHIADATCGENDPNFPLYDPLHKLYHHFWQAHLAMPAAGVGQGPDIGHAVSADMVTWAHLPVAVWNDQPYDNVAIYTGSATIVNGTPTMVYPGLCTKRDWPACDTGTLLALAVPADHAGDPLLTNWAKPAANPIVENTQRDPSSAWRTAAGEWRMTTFEGKVYASADFVTWAPAGGGAALFEQAECPDFFPLPPLCAGNGCANATGPLPTHVHKESSNSQDWYTLGTYADGAPGSTGVWTPLPGVPRLQPLDFSVGGAGMHFYASKSFEDPHPAGPAPRRVYYGWALVPPASTQTLARVTEYHAGLRRLVFSPLPELAALRVAPPLVGPAATVALAPGDTAWLGDWAPGAGNTSEVAATFVLPPRGSGRFLFGLAVLAGRAAGGANVSTPVLVSYDAGSFTANVTVGGTDASYFMPGVDFPGGDYNVTDVTYTDPRICQAACTADGERCQAYTYVTRPPLAGSCCLKGSVPAADANPTCTSGVKHGGAGVGGAHAALPLLPGDAAVDVRVFVDNTFVEVFVMQGRAAFTYGVNGGAEAGAAGVTLFAGDANAAPVSAVGVAVWRMRSIWTTTDAVLAARRGGGPPTAAPAAAAAGAAVP